jgi:phosphoglycerate-specific signal transduction histidine kinase
VPTFFAHLPVLGGLLRRVSLGTIQRLIEDILYIVKKVRHMNRRISTGAVCGVHAVITQVLHLVQQHLVDC